MIYQSYEKEKVKFSKHVQERPVDDVPSDVNIFSSHLLYKLKVSEKQEL